MFLFHLPHKKTLYYFLGVVVLLSGILIFPYLYAYWQTPENHYCTGLIGYPDTEVCDQNFYIAWGAAQIANGHHLLEDKLNGHTDQRLVFNLWWWITGNVQKLLNADVYLLNHAQRYVASLLLCVVIFNLIAQFISEKKYHFMAFLLVLFSGYNLSPYPEGNVFESMLWEVVLPAGYIFFLVTLYYCYRAAFISRSEIWKAMLAAFIMGWVYPYATVSVCFVMFNTYLFLVYNKKIELTQAARDWLLLLFAVLPVVAYDYYIVHSDSKYIQGIANFTSQPLYTFLPAYGLLFVLALVGIYFTRKNNFSINYFLVIWLLSTLVQIYFPISLIPFQIQLIVGIQLPMSILAVYGLKCLIEKWPYPTGHSQAFRISFVLIFVSVSATNGIMYYRIMQHIGKKIMPIYLEQEVVAGMNWLKQNSLEDEVVIATPIISSYIPVISHNRIYSSDYYAPTPDFSEKEKYMNWLFDNKIEKTDSAIATFMNDNRLTYIFQNHYNKRQNERLTDTLFSANKILSLSFQNPYVRIYKLRNIPAL